MPKRKTITTTITTQSQRKRQLQRLSLVRLKRKKNLKSIGNMKAILEKIVSFFKRKEKKINNLQLSIVSFTNESWLSSLQRQGRLSDYYSIK